MAGKKIFIEYDIDASDLKIANGETLSLTQQLRILKKELQRGDIGEKQFEILRKKIGDTEDQISRTTVKSKDFFGVLSSLPGPVGQFGSSLLGVVDTLKIFSSFTFKDIKNSLSDIGDDIVEISSNFLGFDKTNKDVANSTKEAANSVDNLGDTMTRVAAEAGATGGAVGNAASSFGTLQTNLAKTNVTIEQTLDAYENLVNQGLDPAYSEIVDGNDVVEKATLSVKGLKGETLVLTEAQTLAAASGKKLTVTTNGLVVAEQAATFWTSTLGRTIAGVLIASGIGIAIVLIGQLVSLLYEYVTGAKAAKEENDRLSESYENLKRSISDTQDAIKDQTELTLLQAKIAGKNEEELFKLTKEGLDKRIKANQDGRKKIERELLLLSANSILTEEDRVKKQEELGDELNKIARQSYDLFIEGEKLRLNEELRIAEKRRSNQKAANEKALNDQKEYRQKVQNDNKTADELLLQLEQENSVLRLNNERDRQDKELANQRANEEKKINQLLISEDKKGKLLEQVRIKFEAKQADITTKRAEEDLKTQREFQRKVRDLEIAAIADKNQREEAERQEKLNRDLQDLEEDKEFIKLSETEKEKIRQNIILAFQNQTNELVKSREKDALDDRLKKLDDELRFLQIRQEAIRAGTRAFYDNQREILKVAEQREIELAEGKEKEITAIKEKYVKLRKDLDQQEKLATLGAIGETFTALAGLSAAIASSYDEEAKSSKEAFEKRKRLQVATAVMSAAGGIIQILAQPSTLPSPFDWIVKGINAAALAVTSAVQIANIKKTQFEGAGGGTAGTVRGMARGGLVEGPGTGTSDSVPTMLSNGEGVMTAGAVTMFEPLLSMMNQMGGGVPFTSNMNTTLPDRANVERPDVEPVVIKTYVVESELTTSQQKQARLKQLSTL